MRKWYDVDGKITRNHPFVRQYVATMLWSSNDESDEYGGEPMDKNYSAADISDEAWAVILSDCDKFWRENYDDCTEESMLRPGCPIEGAGHDFWLTRNRHGAGFWDGDWEYPMAIRLTENAKAFGEAFPYIGDDGQVHI